jgi:hypothetical protein
MIWALLSQYRRGGVRGWTAASAAHTRWVTRRLSVDPEARGKLYQTMTTIAEQSGASLHTYPRPGRSVRRVVLQDTHDDRGTLFEAAQMEDDGTLRITGHDTGSRVSDFFGAGITSYEWVYVIPPGRVAALIQALDAEQDNDVLDSLASYYQQ